MSTYYLQQNYANLPKGIALELTDPTSAHLQARALLRNSNPYPVSYYRVLGSDEIYALEPYLVNKVHPDDPSRTGVVIVNSVRIDIDRLREKGDFKVGFEIKYPQATLFAIIDDRDIPEALLVLKSLEISPLIEKAVGNTFRWNKERKMEKYWVIPDFDRVFWHAITAFEDEYYLAKKRIHKSTNEEIYSSDKGIKNALVDRTHIV
jgi:hypothetical protein